MEVCDGSKYARQTPQPRPHPWELEDDFLGHERRRDWRAARRARSESPRHRRLYTSACHVPHHQKQTRTPKQLPPSDEEKIALFDTMFAYSGTYAVEVDRVVHHVDLSWNEAWSGTDQVRFCRVDDQTLTYTSTPAKNPFDGREVVHEVTYERE